MTEQDPEVHDEDHETAAQRLQRRIETGYAATTLAMRARLDADVESEEQWFDRAVTRCYTCQRTLHETGVCDKHRRQFGIPD